MIALDTPAQFGQIGKTGEADVLQQCREPMLGWFFSASDHSINTHTSGQGLAALEIAPYDAKPQTRKTGGEPSSCSLLSGKSSAKPFQKAEGKLLDLKPHHGAGA